MMLDHLNISVEDLYFFYHVVDKGGFLKASEALKVCQGKISRRVSRVESAFGSILLYRNMRDVRLTDTGRIVFNLAKSVVEDTNQAHADVKNYQKDPSGPIRLSVVMGFAHYWVMPRMAKFKERYPDIKVHLTTDELGQGDLMMGGADIAISTVPPATRSRLQSDFLCEYPFHIYASKAYLKRRGTPRSVQDLDDHDIISVDGPDLVTGRKELFNALLWLGKNSNEFRSATTTTSTDLAVVSAAIAGLGLAGLPVFFAKKHPELTRVLLEGEEILDSYKNQKFVTYPKSLESSVRHQKLIRFFQEEAQKTKF